MRIADLGRAKDIMDKGEASLLAAFLVGLLGITIVEGGIVWARAWVKRRAGLEDRPQVAFSFRTTQAARSGVIKMVVARIRAVQPLDRVGLADALVANIWFGRHHHAVK